MQELMNGLVQGSIYGLAAIGLSLIFGVVRVPHFAHGESIMVGGMIALVSTTSGGLPIAVGLLLGAGAATLLGVLMAVLVYNPLRHRPEVSLLVCSLALVTIASSIAFKLWGDSPRVIPGGPSQVVSIFGAQVTVMKIVIVLTSAVLSVGLHQFVRRTRHGRAMHAMAVNEYAARLMGIPTLRYAAIAFGVGSLLAGIGGVLLGTIQPIQFDMGAGLALKSFIIIIFSGMGSIGGAWVGGLVLGLAESYGATYISSGYVETYSFAVLLVVLLVRPQGLFGSVMTRD